MNNVQMTEEQRALADAAFANRLNVIHHAYVDITGDLIAGALLNQILYWFGADRNGRTRARIVREGFYWIAKTRTDWYDEIRISPKQYDRAAKILKDKGFIEVRTMKFAGNPTTHIRIIPHVLNAALDAWKWEKVQELQGVAAGSSALVPVAAGFSPMGNNGFDQTASTLYPFGSSGNSQTVNNAFHNQYRTYTENTAENTKENTAQNTHTLAERETLFATIWAAYPKQEGRARAFKAFCNALDNGAHSEVIYVASVLYRQHIEHALLNGETEIRYVPTGGTWFVEERWQDKPLSISSKLEFEEGLEYNRMYARLRTMAYESADPYTIRDCVTDLASQLPY